MIETIVDIKHYPFKVDESNLVVGAALHRQFGSLIDSLKLNTGDSEAITGAFSQQL